MISRGRLAAIAALAACASHALLPELAKGAGLAERQDAANRTPPSAAEPSALSCAASERRHVRRVIAVARRFTTDAVQIETAGGVIGTTAEHAFFVLGKGFTPAETLSRGDKLAGGGFAMAVPVVAVSRTSGAAHEVWNLVVDRDHTYRVGLNAVLVHNGGNCVAHPEAEGSRHRARIEWRSAGDPPTTSRSRLQLRPLSARETATSRLATGDDGPSAQSVMQWLKTDKREFTPPQISVLDAVRGLYESGTHEPGLNVMRGGHVVVNDGGDYYDYWTSMIRSRSSEMANLGARRSPRSGTLPTSHYRTTPGDQYEIRLPNGERNWGALLFGKTPEGNTWFQIEAHSGTWHWGLGWRFPTDVWAHCNDYLSHIGDGFKNIGPVGSSLHSEKTGTAVFVENPPKAALAHLAPSSAFPNW